VAAGNKNVKATRVTGLVMDLIMGLTSRTALSRDARVRGKKQLDDSYARAGVSRQTEFRSFRTAANALES
jgi:hypothetical protein